MKTQLKYNHKIKATGLVEVIVVIAILAMTMLAVVGVTTRALRQVKRNEIEDRVTGIQLRALEYIKSPIDISANNIDLPTSTNPNYYSVNFNANNGQLVLTPQVLTQNLSKQAPYNCNSSSVYFVSGLDSGDVVCNQIIITRPDAGKEVYEVRSVLVYQALDEFYSKELLGYRIEAD